MVYGRLLRTDVVASTTEAKVISIYKEAGNCPLPWFTKEKRGAFQRNHPPPPFVDVVEPWAVLAGQLWFPAIHNTQVLVTRRGHVRDKAVMQGQTDDSGVGRSARIKSATPSRCSRPKTDKFNDTAPPPTRIPIHLRCYKTELLRRCNPEQFVSHARRCPRLSLLLLCVLLASEQPGFQTGV